MVKVNSYMTSLKSRIKIEHVDVITVGGMILSINHEIDVIAYQLKRIVLVTENHVTTTQPNWHQVSLGFFHDLWFISKKYL